MLLSIWEFLAASFVSEGSVAGTDWGCDGVTGEQTGETFSALNTYSCHFLIESYPQFTCCFQTAPLWKKGTFCVFRAQTSAKQPLAESLVQDLSPCTLSCPLLPLPPRSCSQFYLPPSPSAHHVVMLHLLTHLSLLWPPTEKWEKSSCRSAALFFFIHLHALSLFVSAFQHLAPSTFSSLSLFCFSACLHPASSFVLHMASVALCSNTMFESVSHVHKKEKQAWFFNIIHPSSVLPEISLSLFLSLFYPLLTTLLLFNLYIMTAGHGFTTQSCQQCSAVEMKPT